MLYFNPTAPQGARVQFVRDWSLAQLGSAVLPPVRNHVVSADACRLQRALLRDYLGKGKR